MRSWEELARAVGAGFEGDVDRALAALADDATFQDLPGEPVRRGPGEVEELFLAYGGRRERFLLDEVIADGDRAAISYGVAFRADAHAYGQRGMALLVRRGDLVVSWRGVWTETDEDLSTWGGD